MAAYQRVSEDDSHVFTDSNSSETVLSEDILEENLEENPEERFRTVHFTKRDAIIVLILFILGLAVVGATIYLGLPRLEHKQEEYSNLKIISSASVLSNFSSYAVTSDAPYCAEIGAEILKNGGSSVDAAIATLFCVGVVHPASMGLGGGALFNIYDRKLGTSRIIDGREVAPFGSEDLRPEDRETGPRSIAVPGELQSYEYAHREFGRLPWKDLVQPTINLCNKGFSVSAYLAQKIAEVQDAVLEQEFWRKRFFHPNESRALREGERIECSNLVSTLETIRDEKAAALYGGKLGQLLVEDVKQQGGILSLQDLQNYRVRSRNSVNFTLPSLGIELFSPPAPASGQILALILQIMDGYGYKHGDDLKLETATLMNHRLTEAFKFAFAAKSHLADEDFLMNRTLLEELASKEFSAELRSKIDNVTHSSEYYSPAGPLPEDSGTGHVSVFSTDGLVVSVTSSINSAFGSRVISPRTGIILNNHMSDFSSEGSANNVEHGKRPMSSMVPTIAVDSETQEPILILGGVGHTRITTGVAQIIFRHLYLKRNVKEAIDFPRLHHQLTPNVLRYQKGFPGVLLDDLTRRGHKVELEDEASTISAISNDMNGLHANVDFRRGGSSVAGL